jgi:hypothetical protein
MWNLSVSKPVPGPEVVGAINALEFEGEAAQYVIDQIEAAKSAAATLYLSGAVGPVDDPDVHYHVGLTGHANPGHVPTAGYDNDTLSVHVFQAAPVTTPEAPDPAPEDAPQPEPTPPLETPPANEEGVTGSEETPTAPPTPPIPASEEGAS